MSQHFQGPFRPLLLTFFGTKPTISPCYKIENLCYKLDDFRDFLFSTLKHWKVKPNMFLKLTFILLKSSLHIPTEITSYNSARKHILVQHIIVNRSINYVNRNNRVKCQHLPGTSTRARGDWPSGLELSILTLKIEPRPWINARMDLFSRWLLLNDHFSLLYFVNQHKSRTFYTIFHYFGIFYTSVSNPKFREFSRFSVSRRNRGLIWDLTKFWGQLAWGPALFPPLTSVYWLPSRVACLIEK